MFQIIKNLLAKSNASLAYDHELTEHEQEQENPHFLYDYEKILKILGDIEANSPLCSVQLDHSRQQFSTSILSIDLEKQQIMLDELMPKEGNAELEKDKHLKLSAYHRGIHMSFNLDHVEIGVSRGIKYYKAAIPDEIYYPQRRKAPRIDISHSELQFNGISQRTGVPVSGYLFDLSRGGAGVNLPFNRAKILRGDHLTHCQIRFEDYVMDFEFDVRFVKPLYAGHSKLQVGGLFLKLSSKSQTRLSHFITSLEREEIRRLKA
jgi:c-di-GMP-binding flagellar brake protein YcgR